jgi:hypothetical protein
MTESGGWLAGTFALSKAREECQQLKTRTMRSGWDSQWGNFGYQLGVTW